MIEMTKMPWYIAFEKVEPYVVKIITPQGTGTGFMIAPTEESEFFGIATAAHVLNFAHYWEQPIRILHEKSGQVIFLNNADRSIDINYERDTASIVIRREKLPCPKEILPLIPEGNRLRVGVEVAWMGFPATSPNNLCFFTGITSCWLKKEGFYFVDGVAINGVSGGPTFQITSNNKVWIIGIVSAYIPNRATGEVLPGLCVIRDIFPLYQTIKELKSFEEAKKKEKTPETPPPTPSAGVEQTK